MMYANFASVYDRLMQDVPYERWIKYLNELFNKHGIEPKKIIDIGCGTGSVSVPLAVMGYQLTGLDLSSEMLSLAEEKARERGVKINFLKQDMRTMDLGQQKFDVAISMTDSLNYINNIADLAKVFQKVHSLLEEGGLFVFDLNSFYKISQIFGDHTYTLLEDDVSYIWENEYDPQSHTCNMFLTFFVEDSDGRYSRFSEEHSETGYKIEEVKEVLKDSGFQTEAVYAEDSFVQPNDQTERIYFVARAGK